jgi:hypothetical protein
VQRRDLDGHFPRGFWARLAPDRCQKCRARRPLQGRNVPFEEFIAKMSANILVGRMA